MADLLKIDSVTGKAYLNVLRGFDGQDLTLTDIVRKVNHQCLIAHNSLQVVAGGCQHQKQNFKLLKILNHKLLDLGR